MKSVFLLQLTTSMLLATKRLSSKMQLIAFALSWRTPMVVICFRWSITRRDKDYNFLSPKSGIISFRSSVDWKLYTHSKFVTETSSVPICFWLSLVLSNSVTWTLVKSLRKVFCALRQAHLTTAHPKCGKISPTTTSQTFGRLVAFCTKWLLSSPRSAQPPWKAFTQKWLQANTTQSPATTLETSPICWKHAWLLNHKTAQIVTRFWPCPICKNTSLKTWRLILTWLVSPNNFWTQSKCLANSLKLKMLCQHLSTRIRPVVLKFKHWCQNRTWKTLRTKPVFNQPYSPNQKQPNQSPLSPRKGHTVPAPASTHQSPKLPPTRLKEKRNSHNACKTWEAAPTAPPIWLLSMRSLRMAAHSSWTTSRSKLRTRIKREILM